MHSVTWSALTLTVGQQEGNLTRKKPAPLIQKCYFGGSSRVWNNSRGGLLNNKHNCVLSNAGLSNALNKTGFCTSLKSGFYFRFHSQSNTKSALPNFICTWNLMLICWKMCSPEPENCGNQNPHTSKIDKLLPACLTNRRRCDNIPEPLAKFGENR